jgi:hypothetical protein
LRRNLHLPGSPSFQKHSVRLTCPSGFHIILLQKFPLGEKNG